MKIRNGFVSNSSSSSFLIKNISGKTKDLYDFVEENKELLEEFKEHYGYADPKFNHEAMVSNVSQYNKVMEPGKEEYFSFGDEDDNVLGHVYDYMLRYKTKSKSFAWVMVGCRGSEYTYEWDKKKKEYIEKGEVPDDENV